MRHFFEELIAKYIREPLSQLNDGFWLKAGLLGLLLLIIAMLFMGPCYDYAQAPAPTPVAASEPAAPGAPRPVRRVRTQALYLSAAPTAVAVAPAPTAFVPTPAPTPPGGGYRSIAFASNRGDGRYYQLYMMDSNGENIQRLTESRSFDRDPHFAYNGAWIAFASNRTGIYQIYILDLAFRTVRQLTQGPEDKTNPIWSPDNRSLIFTLHSRAGRIQLAMMNADGTGYRQLTDTHGDNHAYSFSPDSRLIAYESQINDRGEVFILDLKTGKSTLLIRTDDLSNHEDPVFSPVDRSMLFTSDVAERRIRQLYLYYLDAGNYIRVTHDSTDRDDPVFSPDGKLIAYIARWENAWNIFVMNADGTNVRNLTRSYFDNVVPTWR